MARLGYIFENAVAEPTRCSTECWGNPATEKPMQWQLMIGRVGKRKDGTDFITVSNPSPVVIIASCIFETTYNCGFWGTGYPIRTPWSIQLPLFKLGQTNILRHIQP